MKSSRSKWVWEVLAMYYSELLIVLGVLLAISMKDLARESDRTGETEPENAEVLTELL